jgi:hypothetical protein
MSKLGIPHVCYFLLVLIASTPGVSSTQDQLSKPTHLQTGNDLLHTCQSDDIFDRGVCGGFVTAASQVVQIAGRACFVEGMTLEQGRDVVVHYLNSHPETRHEAAVSLASRALTRAFPCQAKSKE